VNDEWKNDVIPEIMDGKNIADFIDPDIAEKLEALEREEEILEAEGFYDDHEDMVSSCVRGICALRFENSHLTTSTYHLLCLQFDSDDEREAAAAKVALGHKLTAQSKKKLKNKARLPRTAGLRTLSDLTTDLTKAGIDPSRVQERAVVIAKVRAAGRKRKRDGDEDGMDVDGDEPDGDNGDDDDWASEGEDDDTSVMDVDGEQGTRRDKRGKANSGTVIARKHAPRSNRQFAGLRDEAVRFFFFSLFLVVDVVVVIVLLCGADGWCSCFFLLWGLIAVVFGFFICYATQRNVIQQASKALRLRNLGQRGRNMLAKAGESDRAIKVKMVRSVALSQNFFFFLLVFIGVAVFLFLWVDSM